MSSGLETEPPINSSLLEEEETCSHGNGQSQAESSRISANGPQVAADVGPGQHGEDIRGHLASREGSTVEPEAALETSKEQTNINTSDAGMVFKFYYMFPDRVDTTKLQKLQKLKPNNGV